MKTNLDLVDEKKETINFPTVIADMLKEKFVNFATTVGGSNTQEFEESNRNIVKNSDNMFAFRTNMTGSFNTKVI